MPVGLTRVLLSIPPSIRSGVGRTFVVTSSIVYNRSGVIILTLSDVYLRFSGRIQFKF